jgi:glycosyltransferase involved in cell wall biosynthesis
VSRSLVVIDADVLGRRRTGDETYVENLLARLPELAEDLRFAALTRRPELVPDGVEPVEVPARLQELRMAWSVPQALRRLRPALAHFQHALPLACPCLAVVTVHDLSFEREPALMGRKDRIVFRRVVPRAARRAARVLAVSERTKADLVELYGIPAERIAVTPNGVDPEFSPGARTPDSYALFVGAIQARKDPLAAVDAAQAAGLRLVVAGPERDPELARELTRRGAELRGYVDRSTLAELYRGAACLVFPSRYEGFGLPVLEAMACGTPVVATPDAAVREVAGDAAVYAEPDRLAEGVRRALSDRDRLVAAGLERARHYSWEETARRTLAAYREVLGISAMAEIPNGGPCR